VTVGEAAAVYLAGVLKDREHPMARAERAVLEVLGEGCLPGAELPIPEDVHRERLLEEMAHKEQVIRACAGGYERTPWGARLLEACQ